MCYAKQVAMITLSDAKQVCMVTMCYAKQVAMITILMPTSLYGNNVLY